MSVRPPGHVNQAISLMKMFQSHFKSAPKKNKIKNDETCVSVFQIKFTSQSGVPSKVCHMLVQCTSAKLFLTEALPPCDDVHLAVGELTCSYGVLSASAPI